MAVSLVFCFCEGVRANVRTREQSLVLMQSICNSRIHNELQSVVFDRICILSMVEIDRHSFNIDNNKAIWPPRARYAIHFSNSDCDAITVIQLVKAILNDTIHFILSAQRVTLRTCDGCKQSRVECVAKQFLAARRSTIKSWTVSNNTFFDPVILILNRHIANATGFPTRIILKHTIRIGIIVINDRH